MISQSSPSRFRKITNKFNVSLVDISAFCLKYEVVTNNKILLIELPVMI